MRETAKGYLPGPIRSGCKSQPGGPRINRAVIDIPAILIWFRAVKSTGLDAKHLPHQAGREDFIRDVRRILQMMRERGLRDLHGRDAVREGYGAERRISD